MSYSCLKKIVGVSLIEIEWEFTLRMESSGKIDFIAMCTGPRGGEEEKNRMYCKRTGICVQKHRSNHSIICFVGRDLVTLARIWQKKLNQYSARVESAWFLVDFTLTWKGEKHNPSYSSVIEKLSIHDSFFIYSSTSALFGTNFSLLSSISEFWFLHNISSHL